LVVAEVRDRLAVNKRMVKKMDMDRFNLLLLPVALQPFQFGLGFLYN
jgi:hypothetical protein